MGLRIKDIDSELARCSLQLTKDTEQPILPDKATSNYMIKLQRETIGSFVARKTRSSELLFCYSSKNKETFWAVIVFTDLLGGSRACVSS